MKSTGKGAMHTEEKTTIGRIRFFLACFFQRITILKPHKGFPCDGASISAC